MQGRKLEVVKGDKYGKMTVMYEVKRVNKVRDKTNTMVLCRCVCGKEKVIALHHLMTGITKSCGSSLCMERKPGSLAAMSRKRTPKK